MKPWRSKMSNKRSIESGDLLALARQDLGCYAAAQWPRFKLAAHHKLMISKLEAVERGEISRLMIFLPPRHGKSLTGSGFFPAWYLGKHPDRQVIFATYGQTLSDDYGRIVRNYLIDPIHQAIFPGCRLSEDSTSAHRFNTTRRWRLLCGGSGRASNRTWSSFAIVGRPAKRLRGGE